MEGCLIDLHLHLDGAITAPIARKLAEQEGIAIPDDEQELQQLLQVSPDCRDLNEFLEKFDFPNQFLQTREGIREAVHLVLDSLLEQGLIYAELRFAPQLSTRLGLTQAAAVMAAIEGLTLSQLPAQLILCCMRGADVEEKNRETLQVAKAFLKQGVCAIDLAGAEGLYPTKDYEALFAAAREAGVPFTIHAGEADGADSVRLAVEYGAKRIGHGVRCLEDPAVVALLAEKRIPLEVCPTSNVCTNLYESIDQVPLRQLMQAGVTVTIHTDDPAIEGTTLAEEYEKITRAFQLTAEEVLELQLHAVQASFINERTKNALLKAICEHFPDSCV